MKPIRETIRNPRAAGASRAGGFTLFELVVVIALLAIISSILVPMLSGLTPHYRMRSCAREIAATIEKMRVAAIVRGRITGIRYNLDREPQSYQIVPPAPDDYPEQTLQDRQCDTHLDIPPGVRIRSIKLPGSRGGALTRGVVNIGFAPMGTTGSHIVTLEAQTRSGEIAVIAMKYNSVSGILDYYNTEVEFQHHDG